MESQWTNVLHFYQQYEVGIDVGVGLATIVMAVLCVDKLLTKETGWAFSLPRRRGRMIRKARRTYVESLATYDFVDKIEERVYQGAITREEAKELYVMMKRLFPVRELFPTPALLKEAIKKRRQSGINDPVPLPPDDPAEVKKGAMFVKA